jgi:hypothetical protein
MPSATGHLERFLSAVHAIHSRSVGVSQTWYNPDVKRLLEDVGATLSPKGPAGYPYPRSGERHSGWRDVHRPAVRADTRRRSPGGQRTDAWRLGSQAA